MTKLKRKIQKVISIIVVIVFTINSVFMFNCVLRHPSFNHLRFVDAAIFDDSEEIKQLKKHPYRWKKNN